MNIINHLDYFNEKKSLLEQLLNLSEELLTNSTNIDLFTSTLKQREVLIQKLLQMDSLYKDTFQDLLTSDQQDHLNHLVTLILRLDSHSAAHMTTEANKVSETIKANVLKQKLIKYNANSPEQGGDFLDYKK